MRPGAFFRFPARLLLGFAPGFFLGLLAFALRLFLLFALRFLARLALRFLGFFARTRFGFDALLFLRLGAFFRFPARLLLGFAPGSFLGLLTLALFEEQLQRVALRFLGCFARSCHGLGLFRRLDFGSGFDFGSRPRGGRGCRGLRPCVRFG